MKIEFVGCSAPYREAVQARLSDVIDGGVESAWLIHCGSEAAWDELEARCTDGQVAVAVLPELDIDAYVRAFVSGASGAVYLDTPSAITADVLRAAVQGEALLPLESVRAMAAAAMRVKPSIELSDREVALLRGVASGRTITELSAELFFSDRTVRRHLQSLYLKLGVQNRAEAIGAAARMGIVD